MPDKAATPRGDSSIKSKLFLNLILSLLTLSQYRIPMIVSTAHVHGAIARPTPIWPKLSAKEKKKEEKPRGVILIFITTLVRVRWFWGVALSGGVLGKVMLKPHVDKLKIHHFGGDFALTNFLFFERQLSPNSVDMI